MKRPTVPTRHLSPVGSKDYQPDQTPARAARDMARIGAIIMRVQAGDLPFKGKRIVLAEQTFSLIARITEEEFRMKVLGAKVPGQWLVEGMVGVEYWTVATD